MLHNPPQERTRGSDLATAMRIARAFLAGMAGRIRPTTRWAPSGILLMVALWPMTGQACLVPVFRYALENWPPDPYEVVLFHRGPLTSADQAAADLLGSPGAQDEPTVNWELRLVDLAGQIDPADELLRNAAGVAEAPWVVVRRPGGTAPVDVVWSGRLSETLRGHLADSPVRRELAKRLVSQGQAAVWLLLECGDQSRDDAAWQRLRDELARVEQDFRDAPPTQRGEAIESGGPAAATPVAAVFSVMRLARTDPAERVLINCLLKSEEDLDGTAEPMAFPVFGRGRVLYALIGKGINESNIREACKFLADECSCWVKAQNPGTDLLMTADWSAAVEDKGGQAAALARAGEGKEGLPSGERVSSEPAAGSYRALLRNSLIGVLGGLAVVAVLAWVLVTRGRVARSQ